jgi:4-amino-4-deoxy-L-arabinose transferase-like glycosyltransferase
MPEVFWRLSMCKTFVAWFLVPMMTEYLTAESTACLAVFLILSLLSLWLAKSNRPGYALSAIIVLCVFVKVYCSLDQYLHEWDERYHALVAKNMLAHPFVPTLYDNPVEPYDYREWTSNHIWLSKPPLPLWFMATSIAVFGNHEFAVRLPGILFASASVLLTFLIARKFFGDRVALLAAWLHGIHGLATDLASGRVSSDGVETCFLFWTQLAMWLALRRPRGELRTGDYLFVGLTSGLAFLSKWQPAALSLVVMLVYHWKWDGWKRHMGFTAISSVVSMGVAMTWVGYCLIRFPVEMRWTLSSLFMPFYDGSATHQGMWYSQLMNFSNFFGWASLALCGFFLFVAIRKCDMRIGALLIWCLIPLLVFSLSEMKRGSHLMLGAPAIVILVSYASIHYCSRFRKVWIVAAAGWSCVIMMIGYTFDKLYLFSSEKNRKRTWCTDIRNASFAPGTVVYGEPHYVELMFYHDGVTAYPFAKPAP